MKKYWRAIVLIVLFIGLASYVYFYEIKGQKKRDEKSAAQKKIFNINPDNVDAVELIYPDQSFKLSRFSDKNWKLTFPVEDEANSDEINKIVKTLSLLEKQRDLKGENFKPDIFELNKPKITVQFQVSGEKNPRILKIGRDSPGGEAMYVQTNEPIAYLVSSYQKHSFDKNLQDLRNKTVAPFDKDKIGELELKDHKKKSVVKLVRKNNEWKAVSTFEVETSQNAVSQFLTELQGLGAENFSEPKKNATKIFQISGGDISKISFYRDTKKFYAQRSDRKVWMVLPNGIDKKIFKTLFDFREKDIFEFSVLDAKKITIQRENIEPEFTQSDSEGRSILMMTDGQWMLGEKKLKNDRVRNLLNSMTDTEVEGFIDNPSKNAAHYGLLKRYAKISIEAENNKELISVSFSKPQNNFVYVKKNNQEKPIYKVSSAFLNNLPAHFESWIEKPATSK